MLTLKFKLTDCWRIPLACLTSLKSRTLIRDQQSQRMSVIPSDFSAFINWSDIWHETGWMHWLRFQREESVAVGITQQNGQLSTQQLSFTAIRPELWQMTTKLRKGCWGLHKTTFSTVAGWHSTTSLANVSLEHPRIKDTLSTPCHQQWQVGSKAVWSAFCFSYCVVRPLLRTFWEWQAWSQSAHWYLATS